MPALQQRPLLDAPAPTRAEVLSLVSTGSLADVLHAGADGSASPAFALQQRLLHAYVNAPVRSTPEKLPLATRGAIIVGLSVCLWLGIGGGVLLTLGLM